LNVPITFLFGSQKNNLMGPFGNVRGTFSVCWVTITTTRLCKTTCFECWLFPTCQL